MLYAIDQTHSKLSIINRLNRPRQNCFLFSNFYSFLVCGFSTEEKITILNMLSNEPYNDFFIIFIIDAIRSDGYDL